MQPSSASRPRPQRPPSRAARARDPRRSASSAVAALLRPVAAAAGDALDEALTRALVGVAGLTTVDRCCLARLHGDDGTLVWEFQWCRDGVAPVPQADLPTSLASRPWLRARLRAGSAVHVEDVAALPHAALAEKTAWLRVETRSTLTVPLAADGRPAGLLVFHAVRSPGGWTRADVDLLGTVAAVLAAARQRQRDLGDLRREQERVRRANAALEARVALATGDLRRSEARYRRLIESLGDSTIFCSVDPGGRVTWLSPSCADLLGYRHVGELRAAAAAWLRDDRRNREVPVRLRRTLQGRRQRSWDLHARHRGGRALVFEIDAVPVFAPDGAVASVEVAARDVTRERRDAELIAQARRRLVEADKQAALTDMVAGMSHEISTPVGVGVTAASHLEVACRDGLDAYRDGRMTGSRLEALLADVAETAAAVHGNLQRTADLLRRVRQVTVDQCSGQVREFGLAACLQDVVRSLAPRLRGTGFRLDLDCPPDLRLRADAGALYPVVANLVLNSLVHGFEGRLVGCMRLAARADGDCVVLEYADDGNGMTADQRAHLYEPFYTTRRGRGGMGLGMHVVYTSVTGALGGTIACASRPGRGVRFTVRIPRDPEGDDG